MSALTIKKVTTIPNGPWPPHTMYMLREGGSTELQIYLSSNDGSKIYKTYVPDDFTANQTETSHALEVADIAERDALVLTIDIFVHVADATADPDINSGAGLYLYSTFTSSYRSLIMTCIDGVMSTVDW